METTFKKTTIWDTTNSTYKWKIYLSNGKSFPGYSKGKYNGEIPDKFKLLFRILQRLRKEQVKYPQYVYGYFTDGLVDRIEFFKRTGFGLYDEKLMDLYPYSYKFGNNDRFNLNPDLRNFMSEFYKEILNGRVIPSDAKKGQLYTGIGYSKRIDEKRYFRLDYGRFKNVAELDIFFAQGISDGYTFEIMDHYRNQYIQKNFEN